MRRKGTPCACECDPCKGKNSVRAINNVSPDPNGDFEIRAGNGIAISQSGDNSITIDQDMDFIEGNNIEITPVGDDLQISVTDDISVQDIDASGDVNIGGTLNIAGDIIQQGSSYETHAEKVYTTNDYIYMRDGAVGGLAIGTFSGFQVKKYDGTNDGRLVIDKDGVARVGDVGDEQPLMTRDESADLNDKRVLVWDAPNQKAVTEDRICRTAIGQTSLGTTGWNTGVSTLTNYPYSKDIGLSISGYNLYPVVSFDIENSEISLFAPVCDALNNGTLRIYASAIPTQSMDITFTIQYEVS